MKVKAGLTELEIVKADYDAIQKISNLSVFQIISDELSYFRQVNLLRICKKFEEKCKKYNKSPKQIAPKFLARFIGAASYEDDETIQDIWADILLDESTTTGANSLRTIETLKNISKDEALLFQKICEDALIVGGRIAIFNVQAEKRNLDDIFRLVDCGLLVSDNTMVTYSTSVPSGKDTVLCLSTNKNFIVMTKNKTAQEQQCRVPILSMTEAGKDILKASIMRTISDQNFIKNARKIQEQHEGLEVSLHRVSTTDSQKISYLDQDLISKDNK